MLIFIIYGPPNLSNESFTQPKLPLIDFPSLLCLNITTLQARRGGESKCLATVKTTRVLSSEPPRAISTCPRRSRTGRDVRSRCRRRAAASCSPRRSAKIPTRATRARTRGRAVDRRCPWPSSLRHPPPPPVIHWAVIALPTAEATPLLPMSPRSGLKGRRVYRGGFCFKTLFSRLIRPVPLTNNCIS